LPIAEIEESYLFTALKPVYDRGRKESARRARGIAAQIFAYGKDTHRCQRNPARDMADNSYFRKPQVQHLKAISQADVPSLVSELQKVGGEQRLNPQTVCALLLALYTGHRDHAIRGAKWDEIDFANRDFIVPGERMKNRRTHKVPLPEQAIEALKRLKSVTFKGFDSFVFASNAKMGYMSENTLRKALHRLGYEVTVHGFRSLITDVLNENGFNPDAIERQLNHQEKNAVRGAYLRSEFENLRRPMMQWFADWCEGKAEGGVTNNVISMQGRR
jgi:integrase